MISPPSSSGGSHTIAEQLKAFTLRTVPEGQTQGEGYWMYQEHQLTDICSYVPGCLMAPVLGGASVHTGHSVAGQVGHSASGQVAHSTGAGQVGQVAHSTGAGQVGQSSAGHVGHSTGGGQVGQVAHSTGAGQVGQSSQQLSQAGTAEEIHIILLVTSNKQMNRNCKVSY